MLLYKQSPMELLNVISSAKTGGRGSAPAVSFCNSTSMQKYDNAGINAFVEPETENKKS